MSAESIVAQTTEALTLRQPRRLSEVSLQVLIMTALLAVLMLVSQAANDNFFGAYNMKTLSRDVAILSLIALGQAIVLIAGGIDLSVGSVVCFVGWNAIFFLSPDYARHSLPFAVVVLGALAFATSVGIMHGLLVCLLRLPPFMVTLCSLLVFRSVTRGLMNDREVSYRVEDFPAFAFLGGGWQMLFPLALLLVVLGSLLFFMHFTVHGRYLYAIGHNVEAARFSGVRIHRLRILSYAICGLLAGLAGLIEASQVKSVAPSNAGLAYELHAITAAVLGGCALRGGQGSLVGVVIGAAILKVLDKMIVFLGLPTHLTNAVIGLVLLAAVIADALVKRRRGY